MPKKTPPRRPLTEPVNTGSEAVDDFLRPPKTDAAKGAQEHVSQAVEAAAQTPPARQRKRARDRTRPRVIIDLNSFEEYKLDKRVAALSKQLSVPPSHFIALFI